MSEFEDIGLTITIIILTVNVVLMVGSGLIVNQSMPIPQPSFLPSGLSYTDWNSTDINTSELTIDINKSSGNSITTTLYNIATSLPLVGEVLEWGTIFYNLAFSSLFYYVILMSAIQVPVPIIILLAVPITLIQILTILNLLLKIKEAFRL